VCAIAIHPENQLIFAAGVNGRVEQLDGSLKPEWLLLSGHAHRVVCIGVSSDNRWVVSGSERGGVKLWNLTTGHEAWTVRDRIIELKAVGFSADNQRVITQDVEGRLAEWDVKTGKPVTRFKDPAPEPFLAIRTADDKLQVVADGNTLRLRHDPGHHPESKWICARLREWAPFDEAWHRKQAYHFAKEFAWFPAAFHQELLVKHHPDRPVLRIQLGVLRGLRDNWSEAWVEFLAAYRMWAYRK